MKKWLINFITSYGISYTKTYEGDENETKEEVYTKFIKDCTENRWIDLGATSDYPDYPFVYLNINDIATVNIELA